MTAPYSMPETIHVIVSKESAIALLDEIKTIRSRRPVHKVSVGEHEAGSWQLESISTAHANAGYDNITAIFRRVLV